MEIRVSNSVQVPAGVASGAGPFSLAANHECAFHRLHWLALAFLCAAMLLTGCRRSPDDLLAITVQASQDAEKAAKDSDPKAAASAASRASKALRQLEKLNLPDDDAGRIVGQARLAALLARNHADLAREEGERRERLASIKARAYLASRGALLQGLCAAAAHATERASSQGTNDLTLLDLRMAESAGLIAGLFQGWDQELETAEPDWAAITLQLRQWSTNPPVEANAFLSMALLTVGQRDLALVEVETMRTNDVATPNGAMLHHGARAFVYVLQGWDRLAIQEAEKLAAVAPQSDYAVSGTDLVALAHVMIAGDAILKHEWLKADRSIAEAVRLSPDNQVVVFMTGERLAANGEWEKAAESLEASAQGSGDEWLAQKLAQRARELRDGRGSADRLVMDPEFLFEVSAHYVAMHARNSEAARRLQTLAYETRAQGRRMLEKISPFKSGSTQLDEASSEAAAK